MDMSNAEEKRVVLGSMTGGDLMVRLMADFAFAPVIINPPSLAWLVHIIIYTATAASKGVMQI